MLIVGGDINTAKECSKMKKQFLSPLLEIDSDRFYPASELFVLIKDKIGGKFTPIKTKKVLGVECIYFEGVDNYSLRVFSKKIRAKGRIFLGQHKPLKQRFKDSIVLTIICFITLGIGFIVWRIVDKIRYLLGIEGTRASRALMRELGTEIEKLVGE